MTIQGIQGQGLLSGFWAKVASQNTKRQSPERGLEAEPRGTGAGAAEEVKDCPGRQEDFVCLFPLLCVRTNAVRSF